MRQLVLLASIMAMAKNLMTAMADFLKTANQGDVVACFNLVGAQARYGGFHSHGGTPKYMVYLLEKPIKMDDDLGVPLFQETSTFVVVCTDCT